MRNERPFLVYVRSRARGGTSNIRARDPEALTEDGMSNAVKALT